MKRSATHYLSTKAEIEALSSDIRLEIVQCFRDGETSIAELARKLDRSPHSLYHHVHKLVAAGVLRETGKRKAGRRDEALYDVVAEAFEIRLDPSSRVSREALAKLARAMLRRTERELARAIEQRLVVKHGTRANTWTQRAVARLTKSEVRAVQQHLQAIATVFAEASGRGAPFSFTGFLFPTPDQGGRP